MPRFVVIRLYVKSIITKKNKYTTTTKSPESFSKYVPDSPPSVVGFVGGICVEEKTDGDGREIDESTDCCFEDKVVGTWLLVWGKTSAKENILLERVGENKFEMDWLTSCTLVFRPAIYVWNKSLS